CRRARKRFDASGRDYTETEMVEGAAHVFLSEARADARRHLRVGTALCRRARQTFDRINPTNHDANVAKVHEGVARCRSARWGMRATINYRKSVRLYRLARAWYGHQP